jgi:hypothetical protein
MLRRNNPYTQEVVNRAFKDISGFFFVLVGLFGTAAIQADCTFTLMSSAIQLQRCSTPSGVRDLC